MIVGRPRRLTTLIILWRIVNQPGDNDLINVDYGAYIGLAPAGRHDVRRDPVRRGPRACPTRAAPRGAGGRRRRARSATSAPPPPAPDPAPPSPTPDPDAGAAAPDPAPPSAAHEPGDDPRRADGLTTSAIVRRLESGAG